MKYGIREICEVVLKAKSNRKIGNKMFYKGEPVIYFDSLKTSTLEGQTTTVYAQGGRGNARLMAWEGERTVTFTMEDALISPLGLMILTGAGLVEATEAEPIMVHTVETTSQTKFNKDNAGQFIIELTKLPSNKGDIYIMLKEGDEIVSEPYIAKLSEAQLKVEDHWQQLTAKKTLTLTQVQSMLNESLKWGQTGLCNLTYEQTYYSTTADYDVVIPMSRGTDKIITVPKDHAVTIQFTGSVNVPDEETIVPPSDINVGGARNVAIFAPSEVKVVIEKIENKYTPNMSKLYDGITVVADYYVEHASKAQQIEITPDSLSGNFYLEASTLFRAANGEDHPAEFIIPNCRVQSNFNFTLAATGDPSTFTFTMDAFPDYTTFNPNKKVICAIQIIDPATELDSMGSAGYRKATEWNYSEQ